MDVISISAALSLWPSSIKSNANETGSGHSLWIQSMKPPPTRKSWESGSVTSWGISVAFWNSWDSFRVKAFVAQCVGCRVHRECGNNHSLCCLSSHPEGIMCLRPPITASIITTEAQWLERSQMKLLALQLTNSCNFMLLLLTVFFSLIWTSRATFRCVFFAWTSCDLYLYFLILVCGKLFRI